MITMAMEMFINNDSVWVKYTHCEMLINFSFVKQSFRNVETWKRDPIFSNCYLHMCHFPLF